MDRVVSGGEYCQDFICTVCLDLVVDALDCQSCQNLICAKCLQQSNGYCPNQCERSQFKNINERPELYQIMKLIKVTCDK